MRFVLVHKHGESRTKQFDKEKKRLSENLAASAVLFIFIGLYFIFFLLPFIRCVFASATDEGKSFWLGPLDFPIPHHFNIL